MKIHVYAICWNEEKLLPFFIRHYKQFADKIVFFDNESTDNSRQIIESHDKCHYRTYSSGNQIRDDLYLEIKNNAWKESRGVADWVIVVDIDELVYSKYNLVRYLRILKAVGFSLIRPAGYNMATEALDWNSSKQLTQLVNKGVKASLMSKPCVFDPNKIEEINFEFGAHTCRASGKVRKFRADLFGTFVDAGLYLLHYKYMGLDYITDRHLALRERLSEFNKERGLGFHYSARSKELEDEFHASISKARRVF